MAKKENEFRENLIWELEEYLGKNCTGKNMNFLILPEADRWDIAVFSCKNGISQFLVGIELKVGLIKEERKNVKTWHSKFGRLKVDEKDKESYYIGTIKKFGDKYYHQDGDPFGQAVTYYIYAQKKPERVLVLEKNEKNSKEFRLVNITGWAKMCDCLVKKGRNLCELNGKKVEQILDKKRKFTNFIEIVSAVSKYII